MDGIHEHHYGMDTRIIAAGYETYSSYTMNKYNRRINFYNTETGGYLDPQRPEYVSGSAGNVSAAQKALNAFSYHTRDIIYLLDKCPDKVVSRAIHEPQNTNGGAEKALKLLKPLKGNKLYSESSDANSYTIATIKGNQIAAACFNNHDTPQLYYLEFNAPSGTTFVQFKKNYTDSNQTGGIELFSTISAASGTTFIVQDTIQPYSAHSYILMLSLTPVVTDTVIVSQFFSDTLLADIPAGQWVDAHVNIPQESIDEALSVRIKYVLMNYQSNGTINVNGHSTPIEQYCGGDASRNLGGISYQSIPAGWLQQTNTIRFSAGDSSCKLWMVSIELCTSADLISTSNHPDRIKNTTAVFYPNPATQKIHINPRIGPSTIIIRDVRSNIQLYTENTSTADISSLKPGIYLVNP